MSAGLETCTARYRNFLVPDQRGIMNLSYYWGKIDQYEAEKILDKKPEGAFLLRDSSHEEFLFSVSYRRNGRTLHARIVQWKHKFSFLPRYCHHYPSLYKCDTISGLLEHYNDKTDFSVPILTNPIARTIAPTLQELARSVICTQTTYAGTNILHLPHAMKTYLQEYHYKEEVWTCVHQLDISSETGHNSREQCTRVIP